MKITYMHEVLELVMMADKKKASLTPEQLNNVEAIQDGIQENTTICGLSVDDVQDDEHHFHVPEDDDEDTSDEGLTWKQFVDQGAKLLQRLGRKEDFHSMTSMIILVREGFRQIDALSKKEKEVVNIAHAIVTDQLAEIDAAELNENEDGLYDTVLELSRVVYGEEKKKRARLIRPGNIL
jgi:hypothetical protein